MVGKMVGKIAAGKRPKAETVWRVKNFFYLNVRVAAGEMQNAECKMQNVKCRMQNGAWRVTT
jgi:hypothetical protein